MNPTDNEKYIIQQLRNLKAFESVWIQADKNGQPGQYIVQRSTKVILDDDDKPKPTR